jgi:ABC-type uncharacterized transport system auxiliary subunit
MHAVRPALAALAVLAGTISAPGCLRRTTPTIQYYQLAVTPPAADLPTNIRVGGFSAEPPYATARMAYRPSPYRLGYHTFHRWAANPRALVATAAREYFANEPDDDETTIYLTGRIRRLEAEPESDPPRAILGLTLVARRGSQRLLRRDYDVAEPLDGEDQEAVAAALSRALDQVFGRFRDDLAAILARE